MKNKIIKISIVLISLLFILFITNVEATGMIDNIQGSIDMNTQAANSVTNFGKNLIGAIQVVGVGVAVIMLLYIAIKYLMAAPSEKADFKKTAVNYAIGAVVLFAAMAILELVQKVMTDLSGTLLK